MRFNMICSNLSLFQGIIVVSICIAINHGCDDEVLKFENRSESLVKGCYHQNNSLALCFEIQPGFLQLTDKKNNLLVRYRKLPNVNQRFYAQILDDNFVWHHSAAEPLFIRTKKIPNTIADTTFHGFAPGLTSDAGQNSLALYQRAMGKLQSKKEMQLLERVSHALHDSANNSEMTKAFHVMSMSLLSEHGPNTPARDADTADPYHHRYKEQGEGKKKGYCKDLRSDPFNNKCMGMCGPDCWCWSVFCGNCCYHKGCNEHDKCCRHRQWSGYCLLPFFHRFRCESYGGYPACLKSP